VNTEDNDFGRWRDFPYPFGCVIRVHDWHHLVQDHPIRRELFHFLKRIGPVLGLAANLPLQELLLDAARKAENTRAMERVKRILILANAVIETKLTTI
jgi:hypothetical protein